MKINTNTTLEFDKILTMLMDCALSDKVKNQIKHLNPYMSEADVVRHMELTTGAKAIINTVGTPPIATMTNLEKALTLLKQQAVLSIEELMFVSQFLATCKRMKNYLKKAVDAAANIAAYAGSINELYSLQDEITRCIKGSEVSDKASTSLGSIRRKIIATKEQIKVKVNQVLSSNKNILSESFVSYKSGRYTLPIKAQYKNKINGKVIDISGSGQTYFVEPASVAKLQSKMDLLIIEEENEVRKVLCMLTEMVDSHVQDIKINMEGMELLDFIFAKAKLSISMKAIPAKVTSKQRIVLKGGRHPFIREDDVVPLDFEIDSEKSRCVVITGPNTGGKTVVLKTVGLFSIMTQCGLHIPAQQATFGMHNMVLCDIGDGQSITENLSTFSSHITNIIEIINLADEQSLVILDELGSGTDPTEGMGIAVAILERLAKKNCLLLATTHYPEIKLFAKKADGFINARMAFDKENMMPLFKLEIGEAGQSCALYIAKRLGMPQSMILRAHEVAYSSKDKGYDMDALKSTSIEKKQQYKSCSSIIKVNDKDKGKKQVQAKFNIGDSVRVFPEKKIGIVYKSADEKGEVGVMIKKEKRLVNHKRLKVLVPASELYPDDYDMSVVLDTVHDRKANKVMNKRHDPNVSIEIKK